ncbi:sensor histidine kinase [Azospirillum sp. RWY-5-1]|uniref:histidine kinase n=1 Tax=Azospirillum oleiclasticum TaxID=2735135 RepID=A0ABX2TKB8_9PROT|nr:sensor histidine kinase [Azospirillum oleiclasticum]NYZ16294.1 sensor histidine kinase [Azospirillum oleiclasticum]NYZ23781.1 sensor histidine kinase [Azospirillum oleiclasticum]
MPDPVLTGRGGPRPLPSAFSLAFAALMALILVSLAMMQDTILGILALAAVLGVGAVALHRGRREREAEDALRDSYDLLEERVRQRTTELQDANARLEAAVADREVLLKEVQHRVKNNLQVICSLLRLQSARLDERSRHGFDESLRRIQSMSLLHDLLYRSDQPARINYAQYLRALCDQLARAGGPSPVRLTVEAEDWDLDVDQVTPLALIASELVSNALHHAFPDNHAGEVMVRLARDETGMTLSVRDNGVGLPPDQPFPGDRRRRGLGLVLVQALAQQAGAKVRLDRESGTHFALTVPAANERGRISPHPPA